MEPNQAPNPPTGPQGAGSNVGMAILSYLSILVIIPLVSDAKNDPFVKFHTKQGLVLLIAWIIVSFLWKIPIFGWFLAPILNLGCLVLVIIGIINAANGQMKELPIIGPFASAFKF